MKPKGVDRILEGIRRRGDGAVGEALRRFDGVRLVPSAWRVSPDKARAALRGLPKDQRRMLEESAARIRAFHRAERKRCTRSWREKRGGVVWGQEIRPVSSVGCYVPGGRFAYPSTVLMTAIPARVAGVKRVVMCTPPKHLTAEVLAAAALARVDEIYQIGSIAAIGALAFGTRTVTPVDLIVGPGGAWVTEAKRLVFGTVGIDMLAGPSEIVVVAGAGASSRAVAADLMAQAEHDPLARATVVSPAGRLLVAVRKAVDPALRAQCRFEKVRDLPAAVERANVLAPEHLSLMVPQPGRWVARVRNAGAIFLGPWSPVAAGDYWAGPSHVLPTARSARFSSGLSVQTFLKRTSVMGISKGALGRAASGVARFATAEGLHRHAASVQERT